VKLESWEWWIKRINTTVDGCEILHQLIGGKHPIIYMVSTIRLVVQDFATINSSDMINHRVTGNNQNISRYRIDF